MNQLERIEQHKIYSNLIKESNAKWPHPEKIKTLKDMSAYWWCYVLREKYFVYCIFYDRSLLNIIEMSDNDIVQDLQDKVMEYCEKTNIDFITRSHVFGAKYYIQSFVNMAKDYNINLDMDECGEGALVPRNFFRLINKFRDVYTRLNREVKGKLGEVQYFTDDLSLIVISYLY